MVDGELVYQMDVRKLGQEQDPVDGLPASPVASPEQALQEREPQCGRDAEQQIVVGEGAAAHSAGLLEVVRKYGGTLLAAAQVCARVQLLPALRTAFAQRALAKDAKACLVARKFAQLPLVCGLWALVTFARTFLGM